MPLPVPVAWLAACAVASASAAEPSLPPVGAGPCIACRASASDPRSAFSASDWAALEHGRDLLATPQREASANDLSAHTTATSLVPRPPGEVWSVLTDFERWPSFMPLLRETHVERRDGEKLWVAQKFRVWFYPLRHTTVYQLDPNDGRLDWRLDPDAPHDIAASEGHWDLVAVDGGAATLVRYDAKMSAGRTVPAFLERSLRERSLGQMLEALRGEVLRRFPRPALPR
ncbi:MAG TPA: SRPBCC family protein [Myxococcota bacterium]|nr:SRPBCC family protein [Myxococcota bacterium]